MKEWETKKKYINYKMMWEWRQLIEKLIFIKCRMMKKFLAVLNDKKWWKKVGINWANLRKEKKKITETPEAGKLPSSLNSQLILWSVQNSNVFNLTLSLAFVSAESKYLPSSWKEAN